MVKVKGLRVGSLECLGFFGVLGCFGVLGVSGLRLRG